MRTLGKILRDSTGLLAPPTVSTGMAAGERFAWNRSVGRALLVASTVLLAAGSAGAADEAKAPRQTQQAAVPGDQSALEPKAIEILKASSARLAAAHSMSFTAVVSYENPSLLGPPLVYTTSSDVTLKRPDRLQVITAGDGPASEFYYDGKTVMAFAPAENLVAVADAPPTVDATLEAAYHHAAIYFPFSDALVSDPYEDIADTLEVAFYIGQSRVVGGTTTDMVAYASHGAFVQIWIGAEDKLPRMARAVYHDDPAQLRHQVEFSKWQLDPNVDAVAFGSPKAAAADHIAFERPDAKRGPTAQPETTSGSSKAQ